MLKWQSWVPSVGSWGPRIENLSLLTSFDCSSAWLHRVLQSTGSILNYYVLSALFAQPYFLNSQPIRLECSTI